MATLKEGLGGLRTLARAEPELDPLPDSAVPLCEAALDVLRERAERAESDWLFVIPRGPPDVDAKDEAGESGWPRVRCRSDVLSDTRDRACVSSGKVRRKSDS
jgi:hypothetical protein